MSNFNMSIKKQLYKKIILISLKLLILFISLFSYKYVYEFRINQEMILKLFVIIALNLWIIKLLYIEEFNWCKNKINWPIYLYIIIISLSLAISNARVVNLRDYIIFISYIIIYFLIINNVDNKKELNSFIKIFFVISFLISIYALIQYYGFDLYFNDLERITSTIGQKNWISNYLSMIFPIIFSYFLLEKIQKNKIIYFFLLSIIYTTLMICQSRGIWISIGLTVTIAIYIIFKFKLFEVFHKNKKWLVLLLVTFLIITIIYSTDNPLNKSAITVSQRALSTFDENDPSINTRFLIWNTTLKMIKDRPIFGSGIGTFKMNYLNYQAEFLQSNPYYIKYSGKAKEAHNEYLQMGAELGIIGLGIFLSILFIFFLMVVKYFNKEKDDRKKIIVFGLSLGVFCFLIHSLFTFPLHVPALGSAFFIILGLTVVYVGDFNLSKIKKEININNSPLKVVINILVLLLMIVAINFLVIKPYVAEIYYFKGIRDYREKNYDDAFNNFKYAVQLDPNNGRVLFALGTTNYSLNIQDEAQKVLQRTKYYVNDKKIFRSLGLSYIQSGNYKEAEEELKHAIYLDPKFIDAYLDLAYLYAKQEEYDKAIVEWKKILEIDPDFSEKYNVLYFIGLTYSKKEMPDKALEYFLEALELAPEGSPIENEIEEEINKIFKSNLNN